MVLACLSFYILFFINILFFICMHIFQTCIFSDNTLGIKDQKGGRASSNSCVFLEARLQPVPPVLLVVQETTGVRGRNFSLHSGEARLRWYQEK